MASMNGRSTFLFSFFSSNDHHNQFCGLNRIKWYEKKNPVMSRSIKFDKKVPECVRSLPSEGLKVISDFILLLQYNFCKEARNEFTRKKVLQCSQK